MDDLQSFKYADFLKVKLEIIENIHNNTYAQAKALEKMDYSLLEKLLKERQEYIDSLGKLMFNSQKRIDPEKNEEAERTIKALFQEVIEIERANSEKAESQKSEMAAAIRHINLGKNALKNGYLKKMPQQYGYFIDKKLSDKTPRVRQNLKKPGLSSK